MQPSGEDVVLEQDPVATALAQHRVEQKVRSAVWWLASIAAFTIVNLVLLLTDSSWRMIVGLLAPRYALRWIPGPASAVVSVEVALVLACSAIFVVLAVLAHRRVRPAFVAALLLYGLDTLFFIAARDFVGFGFHVLALYYVYIGMGAAAQLGPLSSQRARVQAEPTVVESAFDLGD
jgi:hypothetical protein